MRASSFTVCILATALCAPLAGVRAHGIDVQTVVAGTAHEALFSLVLSGDAGVAVGAAGQLLESADAGKTWRPVTPAPTPLALLAVGIDSGRAIAVGQQGVILTRSESGRWTAVSSGTDARLLAVSLNSAGRIVAGGAFGVVLKSDDGGTHWASIAPKWADYTEQGADPHVYGVKVDMAGTITIDGEFGLILRSNDGGATWQGLRKGDASLFALDLRDDGGGYAVGQNGTVLRTRDGGSTWQPVDIGSTANLLGVASSANGTVYIVGMHELLASADDGRTWQRTTSPERALPWLAGVAMTAESTAAVAVGYAGRIVRLER
jgi:photosystem II stability/assembly factor-like uncharacterized protein